MRLYILIRDDLKPGQQAVQAGHALASFMLRHPKNEWKNKTLIYLTVDYWQLDVWKNIAEIKNLQYAIFREPDYNNEQTAIAILANDETKKMFSNLPLLK